MSVKPKKKCCLSKPRCTRCPIRMLAEGTMPAGYTVHRLRLVKVGPSEKAHLNVAASTLTKPGKKAKKRKKGKKN